MLDGDELDKNKGLTDAEVEVVEDLLQEGFAHWTKKDFLGADALRSDSIRSDQIRLD